MTERCCPTCGKDMPAGAKICEGCGTPLPPELQSNQSPPSQINSQGAGEASLPLPPETQTSGFPQTTPNDKFLVPPVITSPLSEKAPAVPKMPPEWQYVERDGKTVTLRLNQSWRRYYFWVFYAVVVGAITTLVFFFIRYFFSVGGKFPDVLAAVDYVAWFTFYPVLSICLAIIIALLVTSAIKRKPYLQFSIDESENFLVLHKGWTNHLSRARQFPLTRVVGFTNGYFRPGTDRRHRYESLWLLIKKKEHVPISKLVFGLTKNYILTTVADKYRARVFVVAMNEFIKQQANISVPPRD